MAELIIDELIKETHEDSEYSYYDAIYFDIIEFLNEYEKLPCLWDKNHEQFRNRASRRKAEEVLSEKLGILDSKTLRRKIRNVRGTYNTEIRRVKLSLEGDSEVYVPKLAWFHQADRFLRVTTDLSPDVELDSDELEKVPKKMLLQKLPKEKGVTVVKLRKPKNDSNENNNTDDDNDNEEYYDVDENELDFKIHEQVTEPDPEKIIFNEEVDDYLINEHQTEDIKPVTSNELDVRTIDEQELSIDSTSLNELPATEKNEDISRDYKKRRRSNSADFNSNDIAKYLKELVQSSENEFSVFGRSVGIQLQKLPLKIALQLQMDIQAHITKARLEYLKSLDADC